MPPTGAERVEVVAIAELRPADSPRVLGPDERHVRALAESDLGFPPIVVDRRTMRVIDGVHRVRAAQLRRATTVEAVFFDGDEESAFILAVRANTAQGLRLSLADRVAAATRILAGRPHWSDRRIAAVTGLAATTVGSVRRSTALDGQSNARLGRDGRVRPLDTSHARRLAGRLIASNPDASIRQIAKAAGISLSTAHDVHKRLRAGADPVPGKWRRPGAGPAAVDRPGDRARPVAELDPGVRRARTLRVLKQDPSLRFSEAGRGLIRWLCAQITDERTRLAMLDAVPDHCAPAIAELAVENSRAWSEVADLLEERGRRAATG